MPTEPDEPDLVAGMLENCEGEVRSLGHLVDTLRSQLALKERANQRLVVVQGEQEREITRLTQELAAQEAAASV